MPVLRGQADIAQHGDRSRRGRCAQTFSKCSVVLAVRCAQPRCSILRRTGYSEVGDMSLIGVSTLELRQMIEQACLPDRCEVSCPDGVSLTLRLDQGTTLDDCVTLTGVPIDSLNSCRDVVTLVGQLREQQRRQGADRVARIHA